MEHLGYQVKDPAKIAAWYCENLGFTIVRAVNNEAKTHFLADSAGTMMIEIHRHSTAPVPDYASMDPLVLHLAYACGDIPATVKKLTTAGATLVEEFTTPHHRVTALPCCVTPGVWRSSSVTARLP